METGNKFIHVFDSLSASIGETLISLKILESIQNNLNPKEIVSKVEEYIAEMKTFFYFRILRQFNEKRKNIQNHGTYCIYAFHKTNYGGGDDDGSIKLVEK